MDLRGAGFFEGRWPFGDYGCFGSLSALWSWLWCYNEVVWDDGTSVVGKRGW